MVAPENTVENALLTTFTDVSANIGICVGKICEDIGVRPVEVPYPQFNSAYSLVTKCWQLFLRPWYVCMSRAIFRAGERDLTMRQTDDMREGSYLLQ